MLAKNPEEVPSTWSWSSRPSGQAPARFDLVVFPRSNCGCACYLEEAPSGREVSAGLGVATLAASSVSTS